jgi:hypothetical protein
VQCVPDKRIQQTEIAKLKLIVRPKEDVSDEKNLSLFFLEKNKNNVSSQAI